MTKFINYSELYAAGGSFARQEVIVSGSTTTIYGGYAPCNDTNCDDRTTWRIRKMVITESGSNQTVQCLWARGSWTNRATLTYGYYLPDTPNMYSE